MKHRITERGQLVPVDGQWWAGFILSLIIGHVVFVLTTPWVGFWPGRYRDMVDLAKHHGDRGYPRREGWVDEL